MALSAAAPCFFVQLLAPKRGTGHCVLSHVPTTYLSSTTIADKDELEGWLLGHIAGGVM